MWITSGQESHVTPPPIRYQFLRSFTETRRKHGKAEVGMTIDRPSTKSTCHLPRIGNDTFFICGTTSQYPSYLNITPINQNQKKEVEDSILENSSIRLTSIFGKSHSFSELKCLSLETIKVALATMAQSTNLLSSTSSFTK